MRQDPKPASSVIVRRDDRFLLVKRANPPAQAMYAFPGGKAEQGETPEKAACRELFEETGLSAENTNLFTVYDLIDRNEQGAVTSHYRLSVFIAEAEETFDPVAADDALELGWYTVQEIRKLPVPASVLECVERLSDTVSEHN